MVEDTFEPEAWSDWLEWWTEMLARNDRNLASLPEPIRYNTAAIPPNRIVDDWKEDE